MLQSAGIASGRFTMPSTASVTAIQALSVTVDRASAARGSLACVGRGTTAGITIAMPMT